MATPRQQIAQLNARVASLEADLNAALAKLDLANQTADDFRADVAALEQTIAERDAEIVVLKQEIERLSKPVIVVPVEEAPPVNQVAQDITPMSISITEDDSGMVGHFIVSGGFPDIYDTPTLGGADAALFSVEMHAENHVHLSLTAPHAAGTLSITITVDNDAGTSAAFPITVNVFATSSEVFDSPDPPYGDKIVVLTGTAWPVTVDAATTAPGFTVSETFASWNALATRNSQLGGRIQYQVEAGFNLPDMTSLSAPMAFVAPTTLGGTYGETIPTGVREIGTGQGGTNGFATDNSLTDPTAECYFKGFAIRPPLSVIQCDQSHSFTNGTSQLVAGARVVSGTSAATVKRVDLESGSLAANTGAGRLVLHDYNGVNFPNNAALTVSGNAACTLTSGKPNFGPLATRGNSGISHAGLGRMTVVGCTIRGMSWNGIYSYGEGPISGATARLGIYDTLVANCAGQDTVHNLYCHNQIRLRLARFVSVDTGGGHLIKSECYRSEFVDIAALRDSGSVEGIASHSVVNTSGTVAINLDGHLTSGGVFTMTDELSLPWTAETNILRITYHGDCSGRFVTLTGTNFSDAPITEIVVGGNNRNRWPSQRFKTLTGATLGIVSGSTVKTGTKIYIGYGIGNTSNQTATVNMSRVQDKRIANAYINQRSIGATGGLIWDSAARTGKFGGWTPSKTPPVTNIDNTQGNKLPFESDGYTGNATNINFGGVIPLAKLATDTSIAITNLKKRLTESQPVTLSLGVDYTVAILRKDGTWLTLDPLQATAVGSATASFNLGQPIGGTGTKADGKVFIKRSSDVWDALDINPRYYNANPDNDDNYFWSKTGARGVRASDGTLDRSKQANYETGYYHDIMSSYDGDAQRTFFRSEPIFNNGYHAKAAPNPQFVYPPCNHPGGLWADVANAATFDAPGTGAFPLWGAQPVGYVSRDNLGPNCHFVWAWPDYFKNFSQYTNDRVPAGNFLQFGGFQDGTADYPFTDRPVPDMRFVNSAGALVKVTSADQNPAPASSNAITVGTHDAVTTPNKLYVTTIAGFTAGKRLHVQCAPHLPGIKQLHATNIASNGTDGGGPFVIMDDPLPRPIRARCEVAAFTAAGADPDAYWITTDQYGTL